MKEGMMKAISSIINCSLYIIDSLVLILRLTLVNGAVHHYLL